MIHLRPHQITARDETRQRFREGKRGVIVVAPTGFGKTILASDIVRLAQEKGTRTLFLAHREELITQAAEKFAAFGLPYGIIMAGHPKNLKIPTQIASIQTIVRRMDMMKFEPDFIIIDECHLSGAPTYRKIVEYYRNPRLLGLSATPQRLDGRSLGTQSGGLFDCLVSTVGTGQLIAEGFLSPFRYFAPQKPDLSDIPIVAGDYDQQKLSHRVDTPGLVGSVVTHWKQHALGKSTILFAVSIQHGEHVAEQFRAIGICAKCISGKTPKAERQRAMADFQSGTLTVIVNCALYIEGIDAPRIGCVGLLAPTRSVTRFLQEVGRGLRTCEGKSCCVILDHAGLVFEHGLPDEPRQWNLEGKVKKSAKDKPERVLQCPQCFAAFHPAPQCPQCGHVFPLKPRVIEQKAGELTEITAEQAKNISARDEVRQARDRDALMAIAKKRGYKPNWVNHMMRFGHRSATPKHP